MKKICYVLFMMGFFFLGLTSVKANRINGIYMDIYIDSNGDAIVNETWNYYSNKNTEIYHPYYNIGKSSITDFSVSDSTGTIYDYKKWDVDDSFEEKKYKYGYNYAKKGVELCLGISHYGTYNYYLKYKINGFISDLNDSQMAYWTLLQKTDENLKEYYIKIYADEKFSDSLDVWGFGDEGAYAYVANGVIELSSNGSLSSDEYVVLLAKFDKNTFNTNNKIDEDFSHYLEMAKEGAHEYNQTSSEIFSVLFSLFFEFAVFGIAFVAIIKGAKGKKKIKNKVKPKNIKPFRELPCGEDIFLAYFISDEYDLNKQRTDFLGSLLLKWIKQDYIAISTENGKTKIIFNKMPNEIQFSSSSEHDMYEMMHIASKNSILEEKAFKKYCEKHYSKVLKWFDRVIDEEYNRLMSNELITKQNKKTTASDKLNELSWQLAGLKQFFKEFGSMQDKSAIEVKLWREYLMYAQIFGVAKKVAKEFKKIYPDEIIDQDLNTVIYVNNFYRVGTTAATNARAKAQSYSSGGGGFSSGGGGGGSFGGGGSMGSR